VGFTASKRVGNAVIRNKAKRRLRAIVDEFFEKDTSEKKMFLKKEIIEKGVDFVVIATSKAPKIKYADLCQDFSFAVNMCLDKIAAQQKNKI
jgi:ribonuclease P protein component